MFADFLDALDELEERAANQEGCQTEETELQKKDDVKESATVLNESDEASKDGPQTQVTEPQKKDEVKEAPQVLKESDGGGSQKTDLTIKSGFQYSDWLSDECIQEPKVFVTVCVVFKYAQDTWSHKFKMAKGSRILDLKATMVKPCSPGEDVIAFDLNKNRYRVSNFDEIDMDETFEFAYIGACEGNKKFDRDRKQNDRDQAAIKLAKIREAERFERERKQREEWLERKAQEEERRKNEEAERKAREEEVRRKLQEEEAERKAREEEAERRAREKAAEEAERKARQGDVERKVREIEAEIKAKQNDGQNTGAQKREHQGKEEKQSLQERCAQREESQQHVLTQKEEKVEHKSVKDPLDSGPEQPLQTNTVEPNEKPTTMNHESIPTGFCEVVVTHVHSQKSVTISVPESSTVEQVRTALCDAIKVDTPSEVRLMKKVGSIYTSLEKEETLGVRREIFCRGPEFKTHASAEPKALHKSSRADEAVSAEPTQEAVQAEPPKPLGNSFAVKVTHQTSGESVKVTLPRTRTVADVKRHICLEIKRGPSSELKITTLKGKVLPDNLVLETLGRDECSNFMATGLNFGPPVTVTLTVFHATQEAKPRSMALEIEDTATFMEVKRAICGRLDGKMADVRLMSKLPSGSFTGLADTARLNGRTEIGILGKIVEKLPSNSAPGDQRNNGSTTKTTPTLTLDKALQLQEELKAGFAGGDFQRRLREIEQLHQKGTAKHKVEFSKLLLSVQSVVFPKYGFPGNQIGAIQVLKAFGPLNGDPRVDKNSEEITNLIEGATATGKRTVTIQLNPALAEMKTFIQVAPGATVRMLKDELCKQDPTGAAQPGTFCLCTVLAPSIPIEDNTVVTDAHEKLILQPADMVSKNSSEKVTVTVRHAVQGSFITVDVAADASILDVRQAVVAKTGASNISLVNIIKTVGENSMVAEPDTDTLNGRVELQAMGMDLPNL